jgi:hypothetical protein
LAALEHALEIARAHRDVVAELMLVAQLLLFDPARGWAGQR